MKVPGIADILSKLKAPYYVAINVFMEHENDVNYRVQHMPTSIAAKKGSRCLVQAAIKIELF